MNRHIIKKITIYILLLTILIATAITVEYVEYKLKEKRIEHKMELLQERKDDSKFSRIDD